MTIVNRPPYQKVDWERLVYSRKEAHRRFEGGVEEQLLKDPIFRMCAKALLPDGVRPTANNVLQLFELHTKHNWKSLVVKPIPELSALLHASGIHVFPLEWTWNIHHSWWEPDKDFKKKRIFSSDRGLMF